jgi:hypothetical protein
MPGKPRHGKRKHSTLNKRKRERQRSLPATTRQPETAQVSMPTFSTGKVDSKTSMPAPTKTPTTDDYAYVIAELKRIGILTGVILVILIVLALVLR